MKKLPKNSLGYGQQPKEGVWVRPIKRGYKMVCCDCGLVHSIDFDHVPFGRGRKVIIRAWSDEIATNRARKNIERRKTATNSAMDAIASLCRAAEDLALTDETVGMMARDIVKHYRKQQHQ
jgi:hypothetical protein